MHDARPRNRGWHPPATLAETRRSRSRHSPHYLTPKIPKTKIIQQNPNKITPTISFRFSTYVECSACACLYILSVNLNAHKYSIYISDYEFTLYITDCLRKLRLMSIEWRMRTPTWPLLPGEDGQEREGMYMLARQFGRWGYGRSMVIWLIGRVGFPVKVRAKKG